MKKYLYLLLLPILAVIATSCDDNDDKPAILIRYLPGNWEVVKSDHDYTKIYNISADNLSLPSAGTVGYSGSLTTYYLNENRLPIHDKVYSWKIVAVEDVYYPLIELIWQEDINGEVSDELDNRFYYRIEELTPTSMKWHIKGIFGEETINFIRRTNSDDK
jgi:hypothetical protein